MISNLDIRSILDMVWLLPLLSISYNDLYWKVHLKSYLYQL